MSFARDDLCLINIFSLDFKEIIIYILYSRVLRMLCVLKFHVFTVTVIFFLSYNIEILSKVETGKFFYNCQCSYFNKEDLSLETQLSRCDESRRPQGVTLSGIRVWVGEGVNQIDGPRVETPEDNLGSETRFGLKFKRHIKSVPETSVCWTWILRRHKVVRLRDLRDSESKK